MILSPEILTLYILNALFALFATIALYLSIKIALYWNPNATDKKQYTLENSSYLTATIIKYIFTIKVPLILFFIFTLDKLSNSIPGAMCGAGVVNATEYGPYLLLLKIVNLYLFAYWIVLHNKDIKYERQPYVKFKFTIFILLYLLLMSEIVLEFLMFNHLNPTQIVDCCGVIYAATSQSYISYLLNIKPIFLLMLFYGIFISMLLSYFLKKKELYALFNLLFLISALITLITFFGTYIYELPTHRCPFCFLQREYNYIGYLLYALLFLGTFNGLILAFIKFSQKEQRFFYRTSLFLNLSYLIVVSYFPLHYYWQNGVWL